MPKSKFDDFPISTFEELESNFHLALEYWRNDFDNKYGIGVDTKGSLDFDNNLADPASLTGTTSDTFTIDTDDTGGDVSLIFGKTNNEFLKWVEVDSRFLLSDDLELTGDLLPTTDGTYDIGSTSLSWKDLYLTGSLYFDDTNEFTHDGVNFTLNDSLSIAGGITASGIINANGGITSDDLTDTAWGIQNQNLLDKTASESLSGLYTWTSGGIHLNDSIPLTLGNTSGSPDASLQSDGSNILFALSGLDLLINSGAGTDDVWIYGNVFQDFVKFNTSENKIMIQDSGGSTAKTTLEIFQDTTVTSGVVRGGFAEIEGIPSGASTANYFGLDAFCKQLGANNITGFGIAGNYTSATGGGGNKTLAIGVRTKLVKAGGGNLVDGIGVLVTSPEQTDGTWDNNYGIYVEAMDANLTTAINAGMWLDKSISATVNYGIVLDGDGLGSDISWGAGQDAKMYYDGTNLLIDPDVVGSGRLLVNNRDVKSMALMVR